MARAAIRHWPLKRPGLALPSFLQLGFLLNGFPAWDLAFAVLPRPFSLALSTHEAWSFLPGTFSKHKPDYIAILGEGFLSVLRLLSRLQLSLRGS